MGDRHTIGTKKTALRLFRGLASSYDASAAWATLQQDRYWKRWVAQRLPDEEGGLILDVGCGTLVMEERLLARMSKFVGVDLTEDMLRFAALKALPNVSLLVRGDAEGLPFPDRTFDSVFSCYVVKYVTVDRFAKELSRVVKQGATVLVYDFARPRGLLAPFLQLYIQAGLRAVGFMLASLRWRSAFAYQELPSIVDEATWDLKIVEAMEKSGFETKAAERLTGGIVFAYCGRKRESPYSESDGPERKARP